MVQEPSKPTVLRAGGGAQMSEMNSVSGVNSYASGGFSVRTNLGRVDEVEVGTDNSSHEARVASTSDTHFVVTVHSQASGTELADDTDLSSDTLTYDAARL